eukprot:scaffold21332_cov57-Phaeocystis_antarctica.AAC.3
MEAVQVTWTAAGPCGRDASPSAWPCQHTLTHAVTLSQDGAARLSTYDARHILQYGAPAGSGHYLAALATFLTAQLQRPPMLTLSRTSRGLGTVGTGCACQPPDHCSYSVRVPAAAVPYVLCTVYRGTTGARTIRRRSSPRPATPAGWRSSSGRSPRPATRCSWRVRARAMFR